MPKKLLVVALAAACAVALAAVPAHATAASARRSLHPRPPAAPVSCPDDALFGFGLDVASLGGRPLGTGQTCVDSIAGCEPFVAFCRRTVRATLTLDLPRGSLRVPLKLLEVCPSESSFIQAGSGKVAAGRAPTRCHGARRAAARAFRRAGRFSGRLVYAELKGVR